MITEEDKKAIASLAANPAWASFKKVMEFYLEDLTNIDNVDLNLPISVEIQLLGRKFAKKNLVDILATAEILLRQEEQKQSAQKAADGKQEADKTE